MLGKKYFDNVGNQSYLIFQPMFGYFTITDDTEVLAWKSNGMLVKFIKLPTSPDNSIAPNLYYICTNLRVKFDGICSLEDGVYYLEKNR